MYNYYLPFFLRENALDLAVKANQVIKYFVSHHVRCQTNWKKKLS